MRRWHFGLIAMLAAFFLAAPMAAAQSVGDQADEAEISAMDLEKAGNIDGAIAKHREAIKLLDGIAKYASKTKMFKENFALTLLNAASVKYNAKDNVGAAALLEEAAALDPASKSSIYKQVRESLANVKAGNVNAEGIAMMKAADYAGAAEKFKAVLAIDPDNKAARINLDVAEAQVALAAGDPATAVAKLQDAVNLDPSRQFLKDELAKAQEQATAKAAEDAKKAAEEAKKNK